MASSSFSSSRSSNYSKPLTTWTAKQNRLFENSLAIYGKDTPDHWDSIAKVVRDKTVQEVKQHYQLLVQDIQLIAVGLVPFPNYRDYGKGIKVVKDPEHRIRNLNI